jgi:hypothetical protein
MPLPVAVLEWSLGCLVLAAAVSAAGPEPIGKASGKPAGRIDLNVRGTAVTYDVKERKLTCLGKSAAVRSLAIYELKSTWPVTASDTPPPQKGQP